ncbi:MAG: SpoIIE family protein phosphatase [Candidatus Wallbacteria bacterium]|nr:SpoIIE family protein phosphatase [Candidatus Wallbacteria bacterium]
MYFYESINGKPVREIARPQKDIVVLGKNPDCDLVLKLRGISRHHCRIVFESGQFFIEDTGSTLGTFLEKKEVLEKTRIRDLSPVSIGELEFVVSEIPLSFAKELKTTRMIIESYLEQFPDFPAEFKKALEKVISEISTLYDIARQINSEEQSQQIFNHIMDKISSFFGVKRGFIMLLNKEGKYKPVSIKEVEDYFDEGEYHLSKTIVNKVLQSGEGFFTANAAADTGLEMAKSVIQYQIHSVICVPLVSGNRRLGLIYLETESEQPPFKVKDLYFLQAIAEHLAIILDKERLYNELAENKVISEQLHLAQEIQYSCLPAELPEVDGMYFDAHCEFARETGGDFYDLMELDGGRLAFLVGDVSGKGIPSALLSTMGKGIFRAVLSEARSPSQVLCTANRILYQEIKGLFQKMFITLFIGIYDHKKRELTYSSAGHESGYIVRGKELLELPTQGMPLGVNNDSSYTEGKQVLEEQDLVFIYTDGIPEMKNSSGEFYETEKLQKFILEKTPANLLKKKLIRNLAEFQGEADLSDDLTFLYLTLAPELTYVAEMPCDLKTLDDFVRSAETFLTSNGVNGEFLDEVVICLYEALTNGLKYGKKGFPVELKLQILNNKLKAVVKNKKDQMRPIPALNLRTLMDSQTIGKRGLPLVSKLTNEMFFKCDEEDTSFYFYKNYGGD